jgi:polysaccharide pyruvyl transferase WcaK-like protein
MDAYLRGYYGYKNFGDELLFFGVIKHIIESSPIDKLYVEVEDENWMHHWMIQNADFCLDNAQFYIGKVRFVENAPKKHKWIQYLKVALGKTPYRKMYKFFGGGEVLTDERKSPHDGWNILLLFARNIRKRTFTLLGGIAPARKTKTHFLYRLLLPRAESLIMRDHDSMVLAQKYTNKAVLHEDFALSIIRRGQKPSAQEKITEKKNSYILININQQELTETNIQAIVDFCKKHPLQEKYFFPCDQKDDTKCYSVLKKHIPELLHYDWTQHRVETTLSLLKRADAGIGCRLHFLLPLKVYGKTFEAIPYAHKIRSIIG